MALHFFDNNLFVLYVSGSSNSFPTPAVDQPFLQESGFFYCKTEFRKLDLSVKYAHGSRGCFSKELGSVYMYACVFLPLGVCTSVSVY